MVEDKLYRRDGISRPVPFLKQPEPKQRDAWRGIFKSILQDFDGDREAHHILGAHLTFRYKQVPSCPIGFSELVNWRPDCIITFIDDAYPVRERVHAGGYKAFTLSELITWRAEETLVGDLLARAIDKENPPPNYVVAIQHPADMVARLIRGDPARVYLSHPISDIRDDATHRRTIDDFRKRVRALSNLAVFEPLAIDEMPPIQRAASSPAGAFAFDSMDAAHRWPVLDQPLTLADDSDISFPLQVPREEISAASRGIEAQVRTRDYRLVEQAECLLIYRPTMGQTGESGRAGTGVTAELRRAEHDGKRIITFVKKGEDPLIRSPFGLDRSDDPDIVYEETEDALWEKLSELRSSGRADWKHFLR